MRASLLVLVLVGVMGAVLAQPQIPITYQVSGPANTAIAYAGDWNEIYFELPNGPETSELTFQIDVLPNSLPTTYFSLRPTSTPDPATATHFEFTIDAGEDHLSIFTYTYRARDDGSYPADPYSSSDNYQLTGPIAPIVLDLNVQLRAWTYRIIPGKASVSQSSGVATITGRVGDDVTLEVNLVDTNHTLPGGNQPIPLLFISPTQSEYDVLNAITPLEPTISALTEHENFTLTLTDFGVIPGNTGYGMYLVQPTWIYDTLGPLIEINIIGGNDVINAVSELDEDGNPTGSPAVARYVGDSFSIELTLGDDDGEVPVSGAVISIVPSDPTTGWNIALTGGPQYTIPENEFRQFNGSFVFSGFITLPISSIDYDIIFETPSGFSSLTQAFSVTSLQKQTSSIYPSQEVPAAITELKVTGDNSPTSTGYPLPGDSFTITLHTNDVAPFASTNIVWSLFVVPLDESQSNPNAVTITSGQATQTAGSNNVLSPPFSGTFNNQGSYSLCLVPSTAEYSSFCYEVDVSVGCSISNSYFILNVNPSANPSSFSVDFDSFDASELPITVSLNSNDVAALSSYVTFLNTSITYQPGVPAGANLFYFQHLAFPPTQAVSCVRVESSYNPLGLASGALCGSVCFDWPTYSASLSNVDTDFGETNPHVGDTITLTISHTATTPGLPSVTYEVFTSNSAWSLVTATPLTLSPTVPSLPVVFQFNGWTGVDSACSVFRTAVTLTVPTAYPYINSNTVEDTNLLGQFDPLSLSVVLGSLSGSTVPAVCGTIPSVPYQYVSAGESVPIWVRVDTDSDVFMTSGSAYTISIAPLQTDRTVNIGTWDRTSFSVNQGDDWQLQNFTFTATTAGVASFLVSSSPADFAPFVLKLRVMPQYDGWNMNSGGSNTGFLGLLQEFSVTFSSTFYREGVSSVVANSGLSRYDNDKRIRIEQYGSANVSIVYPVPDADGWITVKRGTYQQPIVWSCNSVGTGKVHLTPAETYPDYQGSPFVYGFNCYDSRAQFIPSSLPLIERGQSVELTFAVNDQAPKTGRNQSLIVALTTGASANTISLGEVRLSERQLVFNQNEYFKTFTAKAVNEGTSTVTGYVTTGSAASSVSLQIGRSAGDRNWFINSLPATVGINTYFTMNLCSPRGALSVLFPAIEAIEIPIPFNIVFSGEAAAGATVVTDDFQDAIPNPQYWSSWAQVCVSYRMIATRAGLLEVSVEFMNTTIGTGKKAITYQQVDPYPRTVLVQEPTNMVTANGVRFAQEVSFSLAGEFVEYFVWHPNPETTESDNGFTLQPILAQSRYGGSVSISAINVRTGNSIGDLFATGIRITPTDTQFVIKIEQLTGGVVNIVWQTSTPGYEPVSASNDQYQRFQLGSVDTTGVDSVPGLLTLTSDLSSFTIWPGAVFVVTFNLDSVAPVDTQFTVSTVAPSADLLTFNPSTFTIPAGGQSAYVEVTATGYGQAYVRAQAADTSFVAPYATTVLIGDTLSISGWQRYMREDRVVTLTITRSANVDANFFQDLQVQVQAAESRVEKGSDDNAVWGFALLDDTYQPIPDNIVTIPAGKGNLVVRAVVNASTNAVTIVRVTAVAGSASGYTDNYVNLGDSYPLVSKKVLTLLGDPLIGKNGTAQMVFFHCPSETANSETFTIYPHGAMLVAPTSFSCSYGNPVNRIWIWGEANRMDIVSEYQRAAYDPREDLSDMAILELSPIGNNGKAETL